MVMCREDAGASEVRETTGVRNGKGDLETEDGKRGCYGDKARAE